MSFTGVETMYAAEELARRFGSLLESQENADVTIVCGVERRKYHSQIICPQSDFFKAAFWGNFVEGKTKILELPDDNPLFVHRMMRYFYLLDYEEEDERKRYRYFFTLDLHVEMYLLGDKYAVEGLKKVAAVKFGRSCRNLSRDVKFHTKTYMGSLLEMVPLVYTAPQARALRQSLAEAIACYIDANLSVMRNEHFKELYYAHPDFAYDTMTAGMVRAHSHNTGCAGKHKGWDSKGY
ncbi:hypothetical protein XANCAGTX0491_008286 [Xanthoria calcicola]